MIQTLVHQKRIRYTATVLLVIWCWELCFPALLHALTSGPSQPEVQAFAPASSAQTVDITSGDFSYNIPLLEVPGPDGGYPINLAYQAGIGAEQEATWVGLGWTLNPGAITRQMRGIPDDFNGKDKITQKLRMKENFSVGLNSSLNFNLELLGVKLTPNKPSSSSNTTLGIKKTTTIESATGDGVTADLQANIGLGVSYNNSKGLGITLDLGTGLDFKHQVVSEYTKTTSFSLLGLPEISLTPPEKGKHTSATPLGQLTGGISLDNLNGPSLSLSSSFLIYEANYYQNTRGLKQYGLGMNTNNFIHNPHRTSSGYGIGTSLSHTSLDYLPTITPEMTGISLQGRISGGGAFKGLHLGAGVGGTLAWSWLRHDKESPKAYGYLNSHHASDQGISDLNRYQDTQDTERGFLAIPAATYDIYTATGQGFMGMFRPYRAEIGTYKDKKSVTPKHGTNFEIEQGVGVDGDAQIGWTGSGTYSRSVYVPWENADDAFAFHAHRNDKKDKVYEPYHFRMYGEAVAETPTPLNLQGGEPLKASANGFQKIRDQWHNGLITDSEPDDPAYNPNQTGQKNFRIPQEQRAQRTTVIQDIPNRLLASNPPAGFNIIENTTNFDRNELPAHHIGGFINLTPSGTQYIYGLPNYNQCQKEYAFTVDAAENADQGYYPESVPLKFKDEQIDYNQSTHHTNVNKKSQKYYQLKTIPKYAHSYMLTGILGTDYIDTKGDGMDDADLGGWIRFNYQTVHNEHQPFPWRAPFSNADYNRGLLSHQGDDKGSLIYGEKEIRYLRMVETASHVAYFFLSERLDGFGPKTWKQNETKQENQDGENLRDEDKPLYKLDKIVLYSKEALKANEEWESANHPHYAQQVSKQDWGHYFFEHVEKFKTPPIKTVHFRYTYELCRGIPNNKFYPCFKDLEKKLLEEGYNQKAKLEADDPEGLNKLLKGYSRSGKLTLKEVYFTYGENDRGKFSPYEFDYGATEKWETHQTNVSDKNNPQTTLPWAQVIFPFLLKCSAQDWKRGPLKNPHYQRGQMDTWGNYKLRQNNQIITPDGDKNDPQKIISNKSYPYLIQPQVGNPIAFTSIQPTLEAERQKLNQQAAVWSIKRITLPSGGNIYIGYEADDYAYVQHQKAMQLMPVTGFTSPHRYTINPAPGDEPIYRIYFKLPQPITVSSQSPPKEQHQLIQEALKKYIEGIDQVYFRAKMKLKTSSEKSTHELVKGYAQLDYDEERWQEYIRPETPTEGAGKIWVHAPEEDTQDNQEDKENEWMIYHEAYLTLRPFIGDGQPWHPIATAAWQFLQQFRPEIMYKHQMDDLTRDQSTSPKAITKALKDLGSFLGQINELQLGFYEYASQKHWGREVTPQTAFIRLNNPNGKKVGGGHRVRYILTDDGKHYTNAGIYGTFYQYEEQDGTSSGVATYEPTAGGEENPWRTAVLGQFNVQGKVFENPINEAYFPAPHVGYRRVTTQSLASFIKGMPPIRPDMPQEQIDQLFIQTFQNYYHGNPTPKTATGTTPQEYQENLATRIYHHFKAIKKDTNDNDKEVSRQHQTSGITENIFYTCRDFPVIVAHTPMTSKHKQPNFNLVLLKIQRQNHNYFQGYAIELNNMHLKPRSVATYGQKQDGTLIDKPISKVRYHYQQKKRTVNQKQVAVPDNLVPVLYEDFNGQIRRSDLKKPHSSTVPWMRLGHSEEVFADARTWKEQVYQVGLDNNLITIMIPGVGPINLGTYIPNGSESRAVYRTHVVNKITHRSGVLKKIETHDGNAVSIAENLLWDAHTGQVLLTKVTNNFGNPIYSYNIPAHLKYDRMGHAYKNVGMEFQTEFKRKETPKPTKNPTDTFLFRQIKTTADQDLSRIFARGVSFEVTKGPTQIRGLKGVTTSPFESYTHTQGDDIIIGNVYVKFNQQIDIDLEPHQSLTFTVDHDGQSHEYTPLDVVPVVPNQTDDDPLHFYTATLETNIGKHLVIGDEFLIGKANHRGIIQHIKFHSNTQTYRMTMATQQAIPENEKLLLYLYRSGRRNLLGASVGNVTALKDPTDPQNRQTITDIKNIQVPPCDSCNPKK